VLQKAAVSKAQASFRDGELQELGHNKWNGVLQRRTWSTLQLTESMAAFLDNIFRSKWSSSGPFHSPIPLIHAQHFFYSVVQRSFCSKKVNSRGEILLSTSKGFLGKLLLF